MFKCGDKCTGILAAKARLVREEVCFQNAKKENDTRIMRMAAKKMRDTQEYIHIMEVWPPAIDLAMAPALMVSRIRPETKQTAIMQQIKRAQETGINPMNGQQLESSGITAVIIKYLIAKHDGKPFIREKRFLLTKENVNNIKYLMAICRENPKASNFLQSLVTA